MTTSGLFPARIPSGLVFEVSSAQAPDSVVTKGRMEARGNRILTVWWQGWQQGQGETDSRRQLFGELY